MKKIFKYILGFGLILSSFSCKKDLDINTNPNTATAATVDLVLPQAIVATANNIPQFNAHGSELVGYYVNGGGVSGWGAIISYNFTTASGQALWNNTYDILSDIEYVLKNSTDATQVEFNAAAKVLKAYNFSLLVDTYNDVPYTEALKGNEKLQPKYDKAADIYKNLGDLLDEAITAFDNASGTAAFTTADPLFKGDTHLWAQFANTLKLRLIIKGKDKGVAFTKTALDPVGFLTNDAIVNPGYAKIADKQNPMWNRWAYVAAGTAVGAASQYVPSHYILSFYNGVKIDDSERASVTYKNGLTTTKNQLGYLPTSAETATGTFSGLVPSNWFIGTNATTYSNIGILKGPDAGQPVLLSAESYFLQAEAVVRGILTTGNAKTLYTSGISASYRYLYKNSAGTVTTGKDPATATTAYVTANTANRLVNYDLATTDEQKIESIITQKYIAFNMLFGHEAWNEYRRTKYPTIQSGTDKDQTFVSIVSQSTAPDKLPTRILYPESEYKYNPGNIPVVDKYSSKIFWAK